MKCKDLRVIQLDIPGMEECLNIASSIEVCLIIDLNSGTFVFPLSGSGITERLFINFVWLSDSALSRLFT